MRSDLGANDIARRVGLGRPALVAGVGIASCHWLGGCAGEASSTGSVSLDSAGIVIVDHGPVDYARLPQLALDSAAIVRIGVIEGAPELQFDRVADVHAMRDGSIAVTDRSRTLRAFDSDGDLLWTAGADGDGPGEFRFPQGIGELSGDTLFVWDVLLGRLTVFDEGGQLARIQSIPELAGAARFLGISAQHRLLLERRSFERGLVNARPALTVHSDLLHVGTGGSTVDTLGRELLTIEYQEVDEGGAFSPAIFGSLAVLASSRTGYWFGEAERFELKHVSESGDVTRIVRWGGPDQSMEDDDFDAVLEAWTGPDPTPDMRQFMREYGRTHPRADRFPSYERLLTDSSGGLWVRDFVRDHEDDGRRRWLLLSPDGTEMLGRLEHDARFELFRVDTDWVLGVERDELDIERIVIRAVTRG